MDELKRKFDEKMTERNKLAAEIRMTDKKFENNKLKRNLLAISFYAIINVVVSYLVYEGFDKTIDLKGFIVIIVVSVIFAGISFLANAIIFSQLVNRGNTETEILTKMEKGLSEIDDELDELRKEYQLLK